MQYWIFPLHGFLFFLLFFQLGMFFLAAVINIWYSNHIFFQWQFLPEIPFVLLYKWKMWTLMCLWRSGFDSQVLTVWVWRSGFNSLQFLCVEIKVKTTYNIRRTFGKRTNEKLTGESEKVPKAAVASGILFGLAPGTAGGCRKSGIYRWVPAYGETFADWLYGCKSKEGLQNKKWNREDFPETQYFWI